MADDRLPRSTETQCGSGTDVDSQTFTNNINDNLVSGICRKRGGGKANSLCPNHVLC